MAIRITWIEVYRGDFYPSFSNELFGDLQRRVKPTRLSKRRLSPRTLVVDSEDFWVPVSAGLSEELDHDNLNHESSLKGFVAQIEPVGPIFYQFRSKEQLARFIRFANALSEAMRKALFRNEEPTSRLVLCEIKRKSRRREVLVDGTHRMRIAFLNGTVKLSFENPQDLLTTIGEYI